MDKQPLENEWEDEGTGDEAASSTEKDAYDYSFVSSVARIALYDDLRSAPRVTEIQPAETGAYIEELSTQVYEQAHNAGGSIPYTVIREVSENFIHARFQEVIVSILNRGNTIRFADQGPGISQKEKAQLPGFSSAIEPMKSYIRGVGSGLPIVKEYLEFSHGNISIEDNMGAGSVVTISLDGAGRDKREAVGSGDHGTPFGAYGHPTAAAASVPGSDATENLYGNPLPPYPQADAGRNVAGAGYRENIALTAPAQGAFADQMGYYAQQTPQHTDMQAQPFGYSGAPGYAYAAPAVHQQAMSPNGWAPQGSRGYAPYPQGRPAPHPGYDAAQTHLAAAPLSERERNTLALLLYEGPLGVTDIANIAGMPISSTHATLKKLSEAGLVETIEKQKRRLTALGANVAKSF